MARRIYNRNKNGTYLWESALIAPLKNTKGVITHFIAVSEDISQRKELEMELIKAKEKAEESDRLKTAFLSNMSHEIRTPMNAIMGFSDLIIEPGFSEQKRNNFARLIHQRATDLLNVINDILDISRIETHQLNIQETSGSITDLFNSLITTFAPKMKRNIKLSFQNSLTPGESYIFSDFVRLKQIFSNLIHNAIKYTRRGSIEFGCNFKNSYTLVFYVKDTGSGIPADKLSVIFQSFRQADDNYMTRSSGGTGLGLSISKGIIELMHGTLWAESKESEGSVFYFTLPYKPDRQVKLRDIYIPADEPYNWKDRCILIVEDDPLSLTFLLEILGPTQVRILNATTGTKALKLFKEYSFIDLILMDIQLPDSSGIDITREILKIKPETPILIQTAFDTYADREHSLKAGCKEYMTKPYTQKDILSMLNRYLAIEPEMKDSL